MPSLLSGEVLDGLSRQAVSPAQLRDAQARNQQLLLRRAHYLPPADQQLLRLALKYRLSVREMATLLGRNHGSIVRRLRRLKQKLCDPIVVALTDPHCPLVTLDREIALDYFLRRRSLRSIASERSLTPREVRRRVLYVKGWASGRREGARAARALLAIGR